MDLSEVEDFRDSWPKRLVMACILALPQQRRRRRT